MQSWPAPQHLVPHASAFAQHEPATHVSPVPHAPAGFVGLHSVALAHCPFTQACPVPHVVHAAPPCPHAAAVVPALQALPAQHPAQVLLQPLVGGMQLREAASQDSPALHGEQAPPPWPQASLSRPLRQVSPTQQPVGQFPGPQPVDEASHLPAAQVCPAVHVAHCAP